MKVHISKAFLNLEADCSAPLCDNMPFVFLCINAAQNVKMCPLCFYVVSMCASVRLCFITTLYEIPY